MFCFHCILFSLLKSCLASSFPLKLLSENQLISFCQLIPLCQTESLPSVLILIDLLVDHPFLENSSLADVPIWAFCSFLILPSNMRLFQGSVFSSLIISQLQVSFIYNIVTDLHLTSHLKYSLVSRYLYQNDEVLVFDASFPVFSTYFVGIHVVLVSQSQNSENPVYPIFLTFL